MQLVSSQLLWTNPGTANLTITNNTKAWFVNNVLTESTTISTTFWYQIDVRGCDHLALQYQSNLVSVTGITAMTADPVQIAAQGLWDTGESPFDAPHAVKQSALATSAVEGAPDFSCFPMRVTRQSYGQLNGDINNFTNQLCQGASTDAAGDTPGIAHRGAVFVLGGIGEAPHAANRTPLTTDYPGWFVWLHYRSALNGNLGPSFMPPPGISGLSTVWVAIAHTPTGTIAAPALKINGRLRALLYRDTSGSLY